MIILLLLLATVVSLERNLLCVVEKDNESCESSSGTLVLRTASYDSNVTAMFRTHSLHATLTYLHHLNKDVLLIDCSASKNELCEQFQSYGYDHIFYKDSEGYRKRINLKYKFGKYFVEEYSLLNFLIFAPAQHILPTIVLSNILSSSTYKGFVKELQYLSKETFLVNYQYILLKEYASIEEDNDFIVMYNTYQCTDVASLHTCTTTKILIEIFKDISTFDVLCKFSRDLLMEKSNIIDVRSTGSSYIRMIVFNYIVKFCKKLLLILYHDEENGLETNLDDILDSLNKSETLQIKIKRNDFEISLPREWLFYNSKQQKSTMLVFCGANFKKCEILVENIFRLKQEKIRNEVEERIMHFVNRAQYKDHKLIQARDKLFCYDIIGDCYDIFKYINFQLFYEYKDRNEKDDYYKMKKNIIIKVYYMIWSVISLRTLRLYESLSNISELTGLLSLIAMDMCDVQVIRVNCLQLNVECNKEKIIEYPTVKVIYPKRSMISLVYKEDPLDTTQLIRFIINGAINPFFYSQWKAEEHLFFKVIREHYEKIILVGLWQNLESQIRTNAQKLFASIGEDYLIVVIDMDQAPGFIKERLFLDLRINPGLYLINLHHLIEKKINVDKALDISLQELKKATLNMPAKLNLKRVQMTKKTGMPIFVVFYYRMDHTLSSMLLHCYNSFFNELSFNYVSIWGNYKMFELFENYKCGTTPCFSVFNYSAEVYTFNESVKDLSSLQLWLKSILNGLISPNVMLQKMPTLEFYYKFDYRDSFNPEKSIFESQNKKLGKRNFQRRESSSHVDKEL